VDFQTDDDAIGEFCHSWIVDRESWIVAHGLCIVYRVS
jgi:hypothetical protein